MRLAPLLGDLFSHHELFFRVSAPPAGAVGCATLLLDAGASPNVANKLGSSPLHAAVFAGHVPLVEALLARGADVHAQDKDGMTPLHWAVAERRFSLIEPLVNGASSSSHSLTLSLTCPSHDKKKTVFFLQKLVLGSRRKMRAA